MTNEELQQAIKDYTAEKAGRHSLQPQQVGKVDRMLEAESILDWYTRKVCAEDLTVSSISIVGIGAWCDSMEGYLGNSDLYDDRRATLRRVADEGKIAGDPEDFVKACYFVWRRWHRLGADDYRVIDEVIADAAEAFYEQEG